MTLSLVCIFFLSESVYAESLNKPSYQWGRGYHIPALKLRLGGYTEAGYSAFKAAPQQLALKDMSLFISWRPFSRLHVFSELELENLFSLNGVRPFNKALIVERLYADFLVNDQFTIRIGKYLTPFSRWNLLHAAPLVWTSSRPMLTADFAVAQRSSGVEFIYKNFLFSHELNLSIFADDSYNLDIKSTSDDFKHAVGSRLTYQLTSTLNLGLSYVANESESEFLDQFTWQHVIGFDFLWQKNQYEFQFESFFNYREQQQDRYGFYLQGVIPLPVLNRVFLVGRYEYMYQEENYLQVESALDLDIQFPLKKIQVGVVGLTWRPAPPIALKLEYRLGKNNSGSAPSGFLSSISLFF